VCDKLREYELMYIITPEQLDTRVQPAMEKVSNLITRLGGEIKETLNTSPWGKRRLAYPIENYTEGYYVVVKLNIDPAKTDELERDLRFNEDVMRHMLVRPYEE
jgi:small subunit ribosomal protein S6